MKFNDVILEANKKIINLNMFIYSCIGTFLMNTVVGVIATILIILSAILTKLFNNIIVGAILTFFTFLVIGLAYVALTYGVITYIYGLAGGNEAHPTDVFKNAIAKAKIVIKVFFRVISRFIIEIIVLIASGITACASLFALFLLFVQALSQGSYLLFSEFFGVDKSSSIGQLVTLLDNNTDKLLPVLVASVCVFLLTSFIIFVRKISYSLTDFLVYENEEYNSKQIVKESKELMKGNKLTYFGIAILPFLLTIAFSVVYFALHIFQFVSVTVFSIVSIAATTYAFILQVAFYRLLKNEN